MRFLAGATPAQRIYQIDADLRPEGKQGPLARSLEGYAAYFERWAQTWERQALTRARPVAGDPGLGERFLDQLAGAVWDRPFSDEHEREIRRMKARVERERIPPGEDPEFHLKLGRGSLSDVEWTAQLLQLRTGIRSPSTMGALDGAGRRRGVVRGRRRGPGRRLPVLRARPGTAGGSSGRPRGRRTPCPRGRRTCRTWPASLDTTPQELREDYRRVTRRARRVVERLFYGTT